MGRFIVNDHRFTDDEVAYLKAWSKDHEIQRNRRKFPMPGDDEPDITETFTPQAVRNVLVGGEREEGHPDRGHRTEDPVTGFDNAPEDVRDEIEPLTVKELQAELGELDIEYDPSLTKPALRDLLAVEWAKL